MPKKAEKDRKKLLRTIPVFGIIPFAVKEHTAADPRDPDLKISSHAEKKLPEENNKEEKIWQLFQ